MKGNSSSPRTFAGPSLPLPRVLSQPLEAGQTRQQSCPAALLAFLSHFSGPRVSGTLSGFALSHPGGRSRAGLTRSLSHTGLNPAPPPRPLLAQPRVSLPEHGRPGVQAASRGETGARARRGQGSHQHSSGLLVDVPPERLQAHRHFHWWPWEGKPSIEDNHSWTFSGPVWSQPRLRRWELPSAGVGVRSRQRRPQFPPCPYGAHQN